jgi:hypothetical protein
MKRNILCISILVFAVLFIGSSLTDSYAGTADDRAVKNRDSKAKPKMDKNAVVVTGTVTGPLQGRVRTGDRDVMITKQTRIYKPGKGMLDRGTFLSNAPVYIIGVAKDGVVHANLVVVSDPKTSDRGGRVRVVGSDEPL